jgi:hypothetical protein
MYFIFFIWNISSHICFYCGIQGIQVHHLLFQPNLTTFNILYIYDWSLFSLKMILKDRNMLDFNVLILNYAVFWNRMYFLEML